MNPRSLRQDVRVLLERLMHTALVFLSVSVHVVAFKIVDSSRGSVFQVRSLFVPLIFCRCFFCCLELYFRKIGGGKLLC